jgi:hypothetical protein
LVTSWVCASLLKMAAFSYREIILMWRVHVFSSLAFDVLPHLVR